MQAPSREHYYFDPLKFCRPQKLPHEERHASITKAAYMRAQRRGFEPGHELNDWLAAEEEFDQLLPRMKPLREIR
jgi:hypothetical protein